jgi:hypothetical protein
MNEKKTAEIAEEQFNTLSLRLLDVKDENKRGSLLFDMMELLRYMDVKEQGK